MPKTINGLTTENSSIDLVQGPLLTTVSQPSNIPGNPPTDILTFDNSPNFTGPVDVDAALTAQSLIVENTASVSDLTVTDAATINDLTVNGSTDVEALTATSVNVQGSITVSSDVTVNNILNVPNGTIFLGPVGSIETEANNLEIAVAPPGSILLRYNQQTIMTIKDVVTISRALYYPVNAQFYSMSGLQGVPAFSAQRMGQFAVNTVPSPGPDLLTLVTGNAWRNDFSFTRVCRVTYSGRSVGSSSPSEYSIKGNFRTYTRATVAASDYCSITCDIILSPGTELWIEVYNFSAFGQDYEDGRVSITVQ